MPVDILIYAVIAGGLVLWLRNILGTRHGAERERPNPFAPPAEAAGRTNAPSSPASQKDTNTAPGAVSFDLRANLARNMSIANDKAVEQALLDIMKADRGFAPDRFLKGAQDAFVMIVEAFAAGDRETLSQFLTTQVYDLFRGVIDTRGVRGEKSSVEIHAIRDAQIIEARLDRREAFITVRFVADETNVLCNRDGLVLEGNPERITETIDVWTFTRDTRSRDPSWLLCETRDEDAAHKDEKTVPDSK